MSLDAVYCSTDDDEIAAVVREEGVRVPFRRPAELGGDDVPMVAVIGHFVRWLGERGRAPDLVVLLQPTSPLRTSGDIEGVLELQRRTDATSVVTISEVPHQYTPGSLLKRTSEGLVLRAFPEVAAQRRRQDKPRYFARNGPAVLAVKTASVIKGELYGSPTFGYVMPPHRSVDIDDETDLLVADCVRNLRHHA